MGGQEYSREVFTWSVEKVGYNLLMPFSVWPLLQGSCKQASTLYRCSLLVLSFHHVVQCIESWATGSRQVDLSGFCIGFMGCMGRLLYFPL